MGMTIDEAIRRIDEHNHIHQNKEPRAVYITEAFDVAINTMRKYQRIEEIVNDRYGKPVFKTLDEVIKVVEDGNNTTNTGNH